MFAILRQKIRAYLQSQLGNPEGDDKPNKKYYDPRKWLREGEKTMVARLMEAFEDLNSIGANEKTLNHAITRHKHR